MDRYHRRFGNSRRLLQYHGTAGTTVGAGISLIFPGWLAAHVSARMLIAGMIIPNRHQEWRHLFFKWPHFPSELFRSFQVGWVFPDNVRSLAPDRLTCPVVIFPESQMKSRKKEPGSSSEPYWGCRLH